MLTIKNLSSGYNNRFVIKDISAEISESLFVGIIGKNGCGKSTLIKTMASLIPYHKGEIKFGEIDLLNIANRGFVSYIPQELSVSFGFSVYEILRMSQKSYSTFSGRLNNIEKKRIDEVIEEFELKNILYRNITTLSGGEKRRVMIARGIAQDSPIILLDEPLSGLDIDHQIRVFQILKKIASDGKIVIASIHDLNMAAQFCDKIILINEGLLVRYGKIEEVLTYNNIKTNFGVDVYVGVNEINNKRFLIPFN